MYNLLAECQRNCLWCGKDIDKGNIYEMFIEEDCLCQQCREKMEYRKLEWEIKGLKVEALYPYKEEGRSMLLQYKEAYDEALYPLFLDKHVKELKKKYEEYTLVPIPSSKEAYEKRGFDHVRKMFSPLNKEYEDYLENTGEIAQKNLSLKDREVKHIRIKKNKIIKRRKYLLVDDLITSGNTLLQAYQCLRKYGQVRALCVFANMSWYDKEKGENSWKKFVGF